MGNRLRVNIRRTDAMLRAEDPYNEEIEQKLADLLAEIEKLTRQAFYGTLLPPEDRYPVSLGLQQMAEDLFEAQTDFKCAKDKSLVRYRVIDYLCYVQMELARLLEDYGLDPEEVFKK